MSARPAKRGASTDRVLSGGLVDAPVDDEDPLVGGEPCYTAPSEGRVKIRCKGYHRPMRSTDGGSLRTHADRKSGCPGWAVDPTLQARLLATALEDPDGGADSFGRPKRIWNAVAGQTFVGVSTNEQDPAYNCYPEVPATALADELALRADSTVEAFLAAPEI